MENTSGSHTGCIYPYPVNGQGSMYGMYLPPPHFEVEEKPGKVSENDENFQKIGKNCFFTAPT